MIEHETISTSCELQEDGTLALKISTSHSEGVTLVFDDLQDFHAYFTEVLTSAVLVSYGVQGGHA